MIIGILYFIIILLANSVGAVSGMGGGVLIKPLLDLFGAHSVPAISFYSSVAVFTMSIVSTTRQIKNGINLKWNIVGWISLGAILGGFLGNYLFELLLSSFDNDNLVQLVQIILTCITLIFALLYTKYDWTNFKLVGWIFYLVCGLILGFLASLLGIGGGPINVAMLMLLFSMPIKEATVYSICTIFFSQLSKLLTITITTGFDRYDLNILLFIIPAAIIGGLVGAKLSKILSPAKVTVIFQIVIVVVLIINIYNGIQLFL